MPVAAVFGAGVVVAGAYCWHYRGASTVLRVQVCVSWSPREEPRCLLRRRVVSCTHCASFCTVSVFVLYLFLYCTSFRTASLFVLYLFSYCISFGTVPLFVLHLCTVPLFILYLFLAKTSLTGRSRQPLREALRQPLYLWNHMLMPNIVDYGCGTWFYHL